jgi:hypothetical protein
VPTAAVERWDGSFIGGITMADGWYYAEALVTTDGAVRIYAGGPYDPGPFNPFGPEGSALVIGEVEVEGEQALGSVVIIGQRCVSPDTSRFCGETARGEIRITGATPPSLAGEIKVETRGGEETWLLDLQRASDSYLEPATALLVEGMWQEQFAEFAAGHHVIMSVDAEGDLFFQSADSGCIGNGAFAPHLDGAFNVYDVTLTIESCDPTFAHLNGEFAGLATPTTVPFWDEYGDSPDWLRIWLATADAPQSRAALTMWLSPQ